ncbi:MAG TPA: SRPBCC family protein [Gemmatimonadaceae bacterium]|nr:SRPBCC family protein [Gemmatimonadaceae bacterium]
MPVSAAANSDTFKVSTPSDREIRLTRLFDAPRDLVFEAMTKPEHVRRWWGQLGPGYATEAEGDVRVGGKWRYISRYPNGVAEFYGEYREVSPPDRLVFTEIYAPFPPSKPEDASVCTVVLTEENGKTRFTLTARYDSQATRDMVLQSGMEKGAAISYDRLEEVAQSLQGS